MKEHNLTKQFVINELLYEQLKRYSQKSEKSLSELIRQAIQEFLDKKEDKSGKVQKS